MSIRNLSIFLQNNDFIYLYEIYIIEKFLKINFQRKVILIQPA